jgi:hypothetical protein
MSSWHSQPPPGPKRLYKGLHSSHARSVLSCGRGEPQGPWPCSHSKTCWELCEDTTSSTVLCQMKHLMEGLQRPPGGIAAAAMAGWVVPPWLSTMSPQAEAIETEPTFFDWPGLRTEPFTSPWAIISQGSRPKYAPQHHSANKETPSIRMEFVQGKVAGEAVEHSWARGMRGHCSAFGRLKQGGDCSCKPASPFLLLVALAHLTHSADSRSSRPGPAPPKTRHRPKRPPLECC